MCEVPLSKPGREWIFHNQTFCFHLVWWRNPALSPPSLSVTRTPPLLPPSRATDWGAYMAAVLVLTTVSPPTAQLYLVHISLYFIHTSRFPYTFASPAFLPTRAQQHGNLIDLVPFYV